jgi:phage gp36-like protein
MAYTTPTIVMRAFPDAQPQIAAVDPELMLISIAQACSEVDAYLVGVYTLPITVEVPLLTRIATDIAIYFIWTAKPFTPPPRPVETAWPARYNAAIELLKMIQSGAISLVGVEGVPVDKTLAGAAWSTTMQYVPTFGESDDRTFRVDPNKVIAEQARRYP